MTFSLEIEHGEKSKFKKIKKMPDLTYWQSTKHNYYHQPIIDR